MIYVLSLILLISETGAILEIKDSFKQKNLEFVESLKNDLRRNNDDYVDIMRRSGSQKSNYTPRSTGTSNIIESKIVTKHDQNKTTIPDRSKGTIKLISVSLKLTTPKYSARRENGGDVRNKIIDKIRRRVNDAFISKESMDKDNDEDNPQRRAAIISEWHNIARNTSVTPGNNPWTIKSLWKDKDIVLHKTNNKLIQQNKITLFSKKNNESTRLPPLISLTTKVNTKIKTISQQKTQIKNSKLEKFKKFIEKNKGLLKDYMSSKMSFGTFATPKLRIRQKQAIKREKEFQKVMREALSEFRGKSLEFPNGDLLDMAPAKGGRIHQKRLKGRLCHRHVLIPEGPKYNSAGRAYLPPHAQARANDYNVTLLPPLLLPRCCNCCRKSVLGCE